MTIEKRHVSDDGTRLAGPTGALIVGGAHGSLAVARSLGRRGIPVWFITNDHPLPRFSRYVGRTFAWPGPNHRPAADVLLRLAQEHDLDGWVLFAGGDPEVRLISQNHAALSQVYRLTTPPWDIARWAYDKSLTYEHAALIGVEHPWTFRPHDIGDVAGLECRFPIVLKPTVREANNAFTVAKAWRVDDRDALLRRYAEAAALVGEHAIVVQELIPGSGEAQFSYAAVWHRGAPVASLVAQRARQYPIDFGYTSTFVHTVDRPDVEKAARRFLASLNYSGLVEIEFKYDRRDARYKLLDVNARPWTWNALGALAGVDFPYLAWRLAIGETVLPIRSSAYAAWMHETRDLVAAGRGMLAGTLTPRAYLKSLRGPYAFAGFAKDDPWPGVVELPLVLARVLLRQFSAAGAAIKRRLSGSRGRPQTMANAPLRHRPPRLGDRG
jgi:predicted ATP-grasp superfamily ATP-dependent carboligase